MTAVGAKVEVSEATPSRRSRIALGIAIALASAVFTWYQHGYLIAHAASPDSLNLWRAANVLLEGGNPWALHALNSAPQGTSGRLIESRIALVEPLYYPMPAVVLWLPLAKLPYLIASTIFNACIAFVYVIAMTRSGLHRAWACGSVPFMIAMRFGQWSPLIVAAWVYPWLSAFLVAKPNLGLAAYAARPSRLASAVCAAVLVLPTLIAPWWIRDWLHNIQNEMGRSTPHPSPVTMFGGAGALLLIALCRWRRPEARLVAFLACVPQLPYWADQLPLLVVAQSRRQMIGLTIVTLLGFLSWVQFGRSGGDYIDRIRPFAIVFTYLPALTLILARPNRGVLPDALERLVRCLPVFVRGERAQAD